MPLRFIASALAVGFLFGCAESSNARENRREPIVGLPCEGCEAVFEGLPERLASSARIAPLGEPGQPMRIQGTVRDGEGHPAGGVIVYAYQTNAQGLYPTNVQAKNAIVGRHGSLRGWVRTDEQGRFEFDTIRPGGYPNNHTPEHVHMHVIEVGRCTYFLDDLLFDDDPRLTPDMQRQLLSGRGGRRIAHPQRDETGRWLVTRDIVLGEGIPGYPPVAPK